LHFKNLYQFEKRQKSRDLWQAWMVHLCLGDALCLPTIGLFFSGVCAVMAICLQAPQLLSVPASSRVSFTELNCSCM